MTIECDDFESSSDVSCLLDWALETGIWDGRPVSWMETSEFQSDVQMRMLKLLYEQQGNPLFERFSAQLAYIGTPEPFRALLARTIQELEVPKDVQILQAGFKKSVCKIWKNHKKEILIGLGILAVATAVAVVAASYTLGAGVAGAAFGGKDDPGKPSKKPPAKAPQPTPVAVSPVPEVSLAPSQLSFGEHGVVFNNQFTGYTDLLLNHPEPTILPAPETWRSIQPHYEQPWHSYPTDLVPNTNLNQEALAQEPLLESLPPQFDSVPQEKSWLANFFQSLGEQIIDNPDLLDPNAPLPSAPVSSAFSTEGTKERWLAIAGINGINTTMEQALDHAHSLNKFAPGHRIDWVYNRSHGPVVDVFEVVSCNYNGVSLHTSNLLLDEWSAFHEANADTPHAKILQFCHSQGTIHVLNALNKAPQEIRDRVIVQAFGPAVIIPTRMCFDVQHYACKGDVIPYGQVAYVGVKGAVLQGVAGGVSQSFEAAANCQDSIIWVERHPDTKSPHDFQNPAFDEIKRKVIKNYIKKKGEFYEMD